VTNSRNYQIARRPSVSSNVESCYYVYLLSSPSRTLYIGVTSDLRSRLAQHRSGLGSKFVQKYGIRDLVYVEQCPHVRDALLREKQIKTWRRSKKLALIESTNPEWRDLSENLW